MSGSIPCPPSDRPESRTTSKRPYPPRISSSAHTSSQYELDQSMRLLMAEKARSHVSGSMRRDAAPAGHPDRSIPPKYSYDTTGPMSGATNIEYWPTSESPASSSSHSFPRKQSEHSLPRTHGLPTQAPPQLRSKPSRENSITAGRERSRPRAPERSYSDKPQHSGSLSPPTASREKGGYPSIEATLHRSTTSNAASGRTESSLSKPPPPSLASGARSRSRSLKGQQIPDPRTAGIDGDSGQRPSNATPKAKKAPEKKVLETVLGIYPAENKLPPGRSAADEFVASIARRFGRKNGASQEDGTSDSKSTVQTGGYYQPWSPDSVATGPPVTGGAFVAELPGSEISPPVARSSSRGAVSNYRRKDESLSRTVQDGSRSQSVPRTVTHLPTGPRTENTYANLAPLIVPSAAGRSRYTEKQGLGRPTTADTDYDIDIAEWAESFYSGSPHSENPSPLIQAPKPEIDQLQRASVLNPEGAVYGEALSLQHSHSSSSSRSHSRPHSRSSSRSTVRSSSSRGRSFPRTPTATTSLDSGGRTSHASSIDAYQYESYDTGQGLGLGTIGEDDGFYGGTHNIHNVNRHMGVIKPDSQMGYDYDGDYVSGMYDGVSDDLQMELELEAMLAARRKKLLAEKARSPVVAPKCALDAEIEAYLAERKKAAQPVEKQERLFELEGDIAGGNWHDEKIRSLRTKY
ncbi:hypothetical protein BZA05DRAFT_102768 [Tricharina praecox]|uniref:uncharacterized protein n=1 Tax=Tricharina praecox TaxID=43433 RepID=UPI002220F39E|nr:uncharacterized protein BZA05DRAFT_102768 [Tricharina praecox]KAI5857679.1 hypothetical protein BZA05DRAFT_102768 [Tricharina praecox]